MTDKESNIYDLKKDSKSNDNSLLKVRVRNILNECSSKKITSGKQLKNFKFTIFCSQLSGMLIGFYVLVVSLYFPAEEQWFVAVCGIILFIGTLCIFWSNINADSPVFTFTRIRTLKKFDHSARSLMRNNDQKSSNTKT